MEAFQGKKMAEGGMLTDDNKQSSCTEHCESPCAIHPQANLDMAHEGNDVKHNSMAMHEDDRNLGQHGEEEQGPDGMMMAEGGMMQDESHEMDMVGRIMKQHQQHFSEGGKVANQDHGPMDSRLADFEQNEFDNLSLRDDLESSYTGASSGDELGDEQEDKDRSDIIARIMKSRAKKDRLPNPA